MSYKRIGIALVICLAAAANCKADQTQKDYALRVYLPREITIEDNSLKLGQIGILRGEESVVAKAGEILLGRISVPGQEIVVSRAMVLSRLASNGIAASDVVLTGAEKVKVKQQGQTIKGSDFVEMAKSLLEKNPPHSSVCQIKALRVPKDLTMPGPYKDIKFTADPIRSNAGNQARVRVAVVVDGKEIGVREVTFGLKYNRRVAIAVVNIATGTSITAENVKIEKRVSSRPESAGWRAPFGLIARNRISANAEVRPNMTGPVESAIVVKRNETVIIRIERPGLLITAIGKTKQQGRVGECIKVLNISSGRVIFARINGDGTVEPVL